MLEGEASSKDDVFEGIFGGGAGERELEETPLLDGYRGWSDGGIG